jgi:hypothetical protein
VVGHNPSKLMHTSSAPDPSDHPLLHPPLPSPLLGLFETERERHLTNLFLARDL